MIKREIQKTKEQVEDERTDQVKAQRAQAEKAAKEADEKEEVTTKNNPASKSIGKYS